MTEKKLVLKAIVELLKGLAGGNVFVGAAPDNAEAPYIVIQKPTSERYRAINGPSGLARADVQVDAYAGGTYDAQALAAEVETILDGYKGLVYHGDNSPQEAIRIGGIT